MQSEKCRWYPCRDSNPGTRFRKPLLYPPELQGHAVRVVKNDLPYHDCPHSASGIVSPRLRELITMSLLVTPHMQTSAKPRPLTRTNPGQGAL